MTAVRMWMLAGDAADLASVLQRAPADVRDRLSDQLWLKTILIEQRRRTNTNERDTFDRRADRLLELLDPADPPPTDLDGAWTDDGHVLRYTLTFRVAGREWTANGALPPGLRPAGHDLDVARRRVEVGVARALRQQIIPTDHAMPGYER